jgi:hypothetical protein
VERNAEGKCRLLASSDSEIKGDGTGGMTEVITYLTSRWKPATPEEPRNIPLIEFRGSES